MIPLAGRPNIPRRDDMKNEQLKKATRWDKIFYWFMGLFLFFFVLVPILDVMTHHS